MSTPSSSPRRSNNGNPSSSHPWSPTSSNGNPISPSRSQGSQVTRSQGSSTGHSRRTPANVSHQPNENTKSSISHAHHLGRPSADMHSSQGSRNLARSTTNVFAANPEDGHDLPLHLSGSRNANAPTTRASKPDSVPLIESPPSLGSRHHKADSRVPKEHPISHSADAEPVMSMPVDRDTRSPKATRATGAAPSSLSIPKTNMLTIVNTNSRQTMNAESHLICYRLNRPSKKSNWEAIMQGVGKADFRINPVAILANFEWVILFSDSHNPDEAREQPIGGLPMEKVATITWHDVLLFLHSSRLRKDQFKREECLRSSEFSWIKGVGPAMSM